MSGAHLERHSRDTSPFMYESTLSTLMQAWSLLSSILHSTIILHAVASAADRHASYMLKRGWSKDRVRPRRGLSYLPRKCDSAILIHHEIHD